MYEIIKAGGWLMWPLILCSVISIAIITERFWALRRGRILPKYVVAQIWTWYKRNELTTESIQSLRESSPLGRVLAAGLINRHHSRAVMKESIEEAGRVEVHEMERFLNTLGTIAAVAPLLGLLGSVVGLMEVFSSMTTHGVGNPQALGSGISKIMIATASGLAVAIPSLIFYRYFQGLVDEIAISLEQEAIKMVEVLQGEREREAALIQNGGLDQSPLRESMVTKR
ncbi:MAG: MotA/TolQ/ExbB proton channel family protein [Gammaproteobacteria bacterium]